MEVLRCSGCGEKKFMSTHAIFHQQSYVEAVERFASEHANCAAFENEGRARRALVWKRLVVIAEGQGKSLAQLRYNVRRARLHVC
jgi:hypothetical protein